MTTFKFYLLIIFVSILIINHDGLIVAKNITEIDQLRTEIIDMEIFLWASIDDFEMDSSKLATYVFNWHRDKCNDIEELRMKFGGNFMLLSPTFDVLQYKMGLLLNAFEHFHLFVTDDNNNPDNNETKVIDYARDVLDNKLFNITEFTTSDNLWIWNKDSNVYDVALSVRLCHRPLYSYIRL